MKIKIFKIILISAIAVTVLVLSHELWFYRKYVRLGTITLTALNRTPCRMKIPVRYCAELRDKINRMLPVSAAEYGTFYLKTSQNGKIYFYRTALEFGGFAVYNALYEVDDPIAKAQLKHLISPNCDNKNF